MKVFFSFKAIFALLLATASAEDETPFRENGRIEELPTSIQATPGKVTIVPGKAFHDNVGLIYVINSGKAPISYDSNFHMPSVTRETRGANGVWQRCDPLWPMFDLECGNNSSNIHIPAGSFHALSSIVRSGNGELRTVRFRVDGFGATIFSAEFEALVDPVAMENCRVDSIGIKSASFEDVAAAATGKLRTSNDVGAFFIAVLELHRFQDDPRLFNVIKEVARRCREPKFLQHKLSKNLYERSLLLTEGTASSKDISAFLISEFNDASNPYSGMALNWLGAVEGDASSRFQTLLEQTLSSPAHPALETAIGIYSQVETKGVALARLKKISKDARYSEAIRTRAKTEWQSLDSPPTNPPILPPLEN